MTWGQNFNIQQAQGLASGLRMVKKKSLMNMNGVTHQLTQANLALV